MAMYKGQLNLSCDKGYNAGAMMRLISMLENTVDFSKCRNDDEKTSLQLAIKTSLSKMKPEFVPRMIGRNFSVDCLLGFGSYGRIWKASGGQGVGPVALKQIPVDFESLSHIWKERDVLIYLKHKRICNIIGAFHDIDAYLVMELCFGSIGSLKRRISNENCYRFTVHLLEAIKWCHSKEVIHADIKPDNCLITTSNKLVLSDFGSCIVLDKNANNNSNKDGEFVKLPYSHGSPGYMDVLANKYLKFSKATDVFSAACVIYEMDTTDFLLMYANREEHPRSIYVDALEYGRVCRLPAGVDPTDHAAAEEFEREDLASRAMGSTFSFLLQDMISDDRRINAAEALVHPFMRTILNLQKLSFSTIDKESEFVTREFSLDRSYVFEHLGNPDTPKPEQNIALASLYYDEEQSDADSFVEELIPPPKLVWRNNFESKTHLEEVTSTESDDNED